MTMPPEVMMELISLFKIDVKEQLATMAEALELADGEKDADRRQAFFNDAMRCAHNLKGAARGIGVTDVQDIAKELETIYLALTNGDIDYDDGVKTLAQESMDAINKSLTAYLNESSLPFDKADLLSRLAAVMQ